MKNLEKAKKIVNKVIRVEARAEALVILEKCSDERFNEFVDYYKKKQENVCCMVLDLAKKELVESNKMYHKEEDYFGSPWLKTTQKEF